MTSTETTAPMLPSQAADRIATRSLAGPLDDAIGEIEVLRRHAYTAAPRDEAGAVLAAWRRICAAVPGGDLISPASIAERVEYLASVPVLDRAADPTITATARTDSSTVEVRDLDRPVDVRVAITDREGRRAETLCSLTREQADDEREFGRTVAAAVAGTLHGVLPLVNAGQVLEALAECADVEARR